MSNILDRQVDENDYQVVSKPSIANKAEANEENLRQSVIDKKLSMKKKVDTRKGSIAVSEKTTQAQQQELDRLQQENQRLQEFKEKLNKSKQENQELRYEVQEKKIELEKKDRMINDLNQHI